MKSKRINQKEIRRQNGIIYRCRNAYELIAIQPSEAPRSIKLHPMKDKLEDSPLGTATLAGTGAYVLLSSAMMLTNRISKPCKVFGVLVGTILTAAVGGLTADIIDRINTNELIYKKYIEYTEAFIDLENQISQELSDDTRITRAVMQHRRNLYDGIKLRAKDLGYDRKSFQPVACTYSKKSEHQLIGALCAEFGKIHAEFVEDIRNGKLEAVSGEQIFIDVGTQDAFERIKAVSERIDEVFGKFGLVPIFYVKDKMRGIFIDEEE